MSIHQTKDGRWFVAWRLPGDLKRVKRRYFGRGLEGRLEAQKWEAEFLTERGNRPAPVVGNPDLTFVELTEKYFAARALAVSTHRGMVYALNLYVVGAWGRLPVAALSMSHLNQLDEALVKAGRSLATRNRYRNYCKTICQWGLDNDLVAANPFAKFRQDVKRENKAPDLISQAELQAIFRHAAPHLGWAMEIMLNTGLRPGPTELLAVRMSDIDFVKGGLWTKRRKTYDAKPALLPVRPEFLEELKALALREPHRQYLVEYKGRPVGSLKTAWSRSLKRAGISRRLRLYDLRHWYASTLIAGGADIKAASELMGHASPTTTLKTYYHLMERQKRQALEHLTVPRLDLPSEAQS